MLRPLLRGELSAALLGCATGDRHLMESSVAAGDGAAVGVVIASEGYPDAPTPGRRMAGIDPSGPADGGDVLCFHASTAPRGDGSYEATGGRLVTLVGRGPDLGGARRAAYGAVAGVELEGAQWRTDIAARELELGDGAQLDHQAG